jgi:hypothetical protein
MRTSTKRTPVAILRALIGLKDWELAELVGCGKTSIHSLESGRMRLSASMAERFGTETGVSTDWLLAGDPELPPIDRSGEPYTKNVFAEFQASKACLDNSDKRTSMYLADLFGSVMGEIIEAARQKSKVALVTFKISEFLMRLQKEFGSKPLTRGEKGKEEFAAEASRRSHEMKSDPSLKHFMQPLEEYLKALNFSAEITLSWMDRMDKQGKGRKSPKPPASKKVKQR